MKRSSTKTCTIYIMVFATIALIMLNPILMYSKGLTANLNNFFEMCRIGYNFSENDTITIIRFLEYFLLGIGLTAAVSDFSERVVFKNAPIVMFVGLFIAVLEVYFKRFYIEDALIAFVWIFIAMTTYVLCHRFKSRYSKKSNSKYKINKYDRRR